MREIENLPLHDAILGLIEVKWTDRKVGIHLKAFTEKEKNAIPHLLEFEGVTNIQIPNKSPWGESELINSVSVVDGTCKIEIQSGDVISFSATSFGFHSAS